MENNELDDIIKENTPRLRSFIKGRIGDHDDVDDIVQDTFYQFLRTFHALENPIAHVSSWLYTVAHNLIINHEKRGLRTKTITKTVVDDESFMNDISEILAASDTESPDMRMLRSMVWNELDRALTELPAEQRDALVMTEIEGKSVREAAELMGVAQNTFLSRKHYAVKHIRKRLHVLYTELIKS